MPTPESTEHYIATLKAARKQQKELKAAGLPENPAVLDEILPESARDGYQDMGLVEIPAERIVGTKSAGRIHVFTPDFLPLLNVDTEFATKWMLLCDAHLSAEGIRDPILCYEYMGLFYVQEGNKRLSVLRSFGATKILGTVRRILPPQSDAPEVRAYYEFLDFYKDSQLYDVHFTTPGSYSKLLSAMGKELGKRWDQWEQRTFKSYLQYFRDAFEALGGKKLELSQDEALLTWLDVYPYQDLGKLSAAELKKSISALWEDLQAIASDAPVQVQTQPVEQGAAPNLLERIFLLHPDHLHIAFVHQLTPETSAWTQGHDNGAKLLQQQLGDAVVVRSYFGANSPEQTEDLLEQAVSDGAQLVFSTTPRLNRATHKVALKHPHVRFFNCSVNVPYSTVRTYYCRIFEGKFITGAIAGAMADNDRIGYIGSNPIYGVPASINAFALGAQMTNPRATVDLRWSCMGGDPVAEFIAGGYQVISNRDVPTPDRHKLHDGEYGTYLVQPDGTLMPLASPCWLWGNFYVRVAKAILNGAWEQRKEPGRAMNYWWGMDSGVIDVTISEKLPESMRYLANVLRQGLRSGTLDPFARRIIAQDGTVKNDGTRRFSAEELLHMDWLCDNVRGTIPQFDEVLPFAQPMLREMGVYKDTIPPETEVESV